MKTTNEKSKWVLDPAHSEILFKAKHLMITNVNGEFKNFNIEVTTTGNDFKDASILGTIDATSLSTNNEGRDAHLKSADFFEAGKYRDITFKATSMKETEDGTFTLKGLLTIKDVTNEVSLNVEFGGFNKDPWGNQKAGFSLAGKINRKDWGLNWNAALETGGVLVSDEIRISAEVQLLKQAINN
jgi:polyisoprenoid-binding protein YceI